jgi:hypothetical protein
LKAREFRNESGYTVFNAGCVVRGRDEFEEARMVLMGFGALLVLFGIVYTARSAIWRGPLSGRDSDRPVRGTLEPPRRGLGFLGVGTNWPGFLMMAIGAVLLVVGGNF